MRSLLLLQYQVHTQTSDGHVLKFILMCGSLVPRPHGNEARYVDTVSRMS